MSVLQYVMGTFVRHDQAKGFFRVHLQVDELLHIETQHLVIITSSIPIYKHRLSTRLIREVLNHPWLRNIKEVTCRLDSIPHVILQQPKTAESLAQC